VARITSALSPPPPAPKVESAKSIEELFDFDEFLKQLDAGTGHRPGPEPALPEPNVATVAPSVLDDVTLHEDDRDPFSVLERQLRENEERRPEPDPALEHERRVAAELDQWLAAILDDRQGHTSA
jgi:hypothetical protein